MTSLTSNSIPLSLKFPYLLQNSSFRISSKTTSNMESAKESDASKSATAEEQHRRRRRSYWDQLLSKYEKRNATLEARQTALAEKVKFMECALPSLLMGAVINSSQKESERSRSRACDRGQKNVCDQVNEDCKISD